MKYYDDAAKIGGIEARVALAKLTGINSIVAKTAEDKPETLKIFENAILKLKADFKDAVVIKVDGQLSLKGNENQNLKLVSVLNNLHAKKALLIKSVEAISNKKGMSK